MDLVLLVAFFPETLRIEATLWVSSAWKISVDDGATVKTFILTKVPDRDMEVACFFMHVYDLPAQTGMWPFVPVFKINLYVAFLTWTSSYNTPKGYQTRRRPVLEYCLLRF